jgi:hypothetical protein
MDVAKEAQTLARGTAIGAGFGRTTRGRVGFMLSLGGLAVFLVSWFLKKRRATVAA